MIADICAGAFVDLCVKVAEVHCWFLMWETLGRYEIILGIVALPNLASDDLVCGRCGTYLVKSKT